MQLAENALRHSVETIWATVLGLDAKPCDGFPFATSQDPLITGSIQITGAWEGTITLDCTEPVARQAAAVMFGIDPSETNSDQVQDALGELTNILSGTLKSQLPEPCRISLPAVIEGDDPGERWQNNKVIARLGFHCTEKPFQVTVMEGLR